VPQLKNLLYGERPQIGRRLIVLIIAFSSAITLCLSVIQLVFEYRGLRSELDRQLDGVKIYVPSIAGSVWDFDHQQVQRALDALILLPNVVQVSVATSDTATNWNAGTSPSDNILTRTYSLRYTVRNTDREIGTLTVVATLDGIYQQVATSAVSIVVSNALKTFLVALFMVYLIRRLITSRLERVASKVHQLLPGTLPVGEAVTLPTQPIPATLDELDAVDWALDQTAANLGIAVSALADANQDLFSSRQMLRSMLDTIPQRVFWKDRSLVYLGCNQPFALDHGYADFAEIVGKTDDDLFEAGTANRFRAADREVIASGQARLGCEEARIRPDGSQGWFVSNTVPLRDKNGKVISILGTYEDITVRKMAEERVEFLAYHDALTELPNRMLVHDRFRQAMAYADRSHSKVALLFLDLDNFKSINDSLGHLVGDELIKSVAGRLADCVRDTDTVSRQGGDEFLIMLTSLEDADAMAPALVALMNRLGDSCLVEGHELTTSASIGISLYPDDGRDFDSLLKKADIAMYRAKEAGRNTYRFFDEQMNVEAVEQLRLRSGLRRALAEDEFVLHYQPQIEIATGNLVGAEALIRWHHPDLGVIPPGRFIPIAEDSGLIVPIGEWALREACRQAMAWQKAGMHKLMVAVNLSAIQFKRGDVEQSVIRALEESGLDPALLELELTESIIIQDTQKVLETVHRLKRLGVKLSIDDFGTGYSSLSYLKRFQVDKLKIDQSFVLNLARDEEDAAIVSAIIQMARSLGLTTIAEGVEDKQALARLLEFGCDEAQGYFFARPMPSDDFAAFRSRLLTGPVGIMPDRRA
jgi:diguanylate cyclase (GGDEF)-like protein/PAS domain S-box-containing protein